MVTWNVWGLRAGTAAVAAELRRARPDVACLQECPRGPLAGWRTRRLARAAGLRLVRRAAGVALLVAPGVVTGDAESHREPRRRSRWWWAYPRAWVSARVATSAPGEAGPLTTRVVVVHLDVDAAARERNVARILGRHDGEQRWLVAGDLNARPGDPARAALAGVLDDVGIAPTYPAGPGRTPRARIDGVLVRGLTVRDVEVVADVGDLRGRRGRQLSDHLPVVVTLGSQGDDPAGEPR